MTPYQEHLTFMKGWSDGAGKRVMDFGLEGMERDIYNCGFLRGQSAFLRERKADFKARGIKQRAKKAQRT